jgi:phage anti-repressor protein
VKKVTLKHGRVDNKNILANNSDLLEIIDYQQDWLDWFWELTPEQKDFAIVAVIKNLDKETLRKAKRWVK